jgi:hypothetical protein
MKYRGWLPACVAGLVLLCGCQSNEPQRSPWEPPETVAQPDDLMNVPEGEVLAKIDSVAVMPFVDHTMAGRHTLNSTDMLRFGESFSSHLTGSETFKQVMFPSTALSHLEGTELNLLRSDDLKEVGNLLDVDAIVFGIIHQYNMYYPPRMSISMKFYLTRAERFATSTEISALAHAGMPLNHYNPTFFRQLWDKSSFYNGESHRVRDIITHFSKTHKDSIYGFESDRFLRTKRDFINLISYDLAHSLDSSVNKKDQSVIPVARGKKKASLPSGYYHN